MNQSMHYIVVGCKTWNRQHFNFRLSQYPGSWIYIDNPAELTAHQVERINPRYIFFLHWSHIVPLEITQKFDCICFHMTDVPYGRGGSPLQNLIVRGHKETKLTALKMTNELDAGPVYFKKPLSLSGSAEEILIRASELSCDLVKEIIESHPTPLPQTGETVLFRRRKPAESDLKNITELEKIYDHIRMLDAEGYPNAFLEKDGFRYEFFQASLIEGNLTASVRITSKKVEP